MREKIVRVSVCVCVCHLILEGLGGRILMKFGTKIKNLIRRKITEPDFRFRTPFRTGGRKSIIFGGFWQISQKLV